MLSDATRTAALTTKSDAKPGMDGPPFCPIADDVLIFVVKCVAMTLGEFCSALWSHAGV